MTPKEFRKLTPEEKLLHIIEKPERIDMLTGKKGKKGIVAFPLPGKGLLGMIGGASSKRFTLRGVNKLIVCLSVILTAALVFFFIRDERNMETKLESLKKGLVKSEEFQLGKKQVLPDMAIYIKETEKNNPFHVLPETKKVEKKEPVSTSNLKLVGIIWSNFPQAMIEDESNGKNYSVYIGDTLDKYTVIDITPNTVKLSSENGEKTLR